MAHTSPCSAQRMPSSPRLAASLGAREALSRVVLLARLVGGAMSACRYIDSLVRPPPEAAPEGRERRWATLVDQRDAGARSRFGSRWSGAPEATRSMSWFASPAMLASLRHPGE